MGRVTSKQLHDRLAAGRRKLVESGVKYERDYYERPLSDQDDKLLKMYLMTVGPPGSTTPSSVMAVKKVLTAYVGLSRTPTYTRVHGHNNVGNRSADSRTRNGAGRWILCMILYIPNNLRTVVSSRLLKAYWEAGHGMGKFKRGLFLSRYFGLHCTITDDAAATVALADFPSPSDSYDLFKPANITHNANSTLLIKGVAPPLKPPAIASNPEPFSFNQDEGF